MTNRSFPQNSAFDLPVYLYKEGTNRRTFDFLGAHPARRNNRCGWEFILWAPNAAGCAVVGDFNEWHSSGIPMMRIHGDFWYAFADDLREFDLYKFAVTGQDGKTVYKTDPFAFFTEKHPHTASRLYDVAGFPWQDAAWLSYRAQTADLAKPMHIYEMHLGSWKTDASGEAFSYTRLSRELIPYVKSMGYTHIELLPVAAHRQDSAITGFYAPDANYGTPKDFMAFVNECHKAGLGVFLDWVCDRFAKDESGLNAFDGTRLYEYAADLPEQETCSFDLGKNEVRSFLISNALFWIETYHIDGLRVGSVTDILYPGRKPDESPFCASGCGENEAACAFLRCLNDAVKTDYPDVVTMAEETSGWRGVTAATRDGGLGFDYKWNLGWTNDTLSYLSLRSPSRRAEHDRITVPMSYAFQERFILPLSHGESVRGKRSLIEKMAGEYADKFANLRLLFAFMMAEPGKKLSFMGNEFAQFAEWSPDKALDFFLLDFPSHNAFHTYIRDLNFFYLEHEALWQNDSNWEGFQWISLDDRQNSVIAFRRISDTQKEIIAIFHFSPEACTGYEIGVPYSGLYTEVFSSNDALYGGTGYRNPPVKAENLPMHSLAYRIRLTLPPFSALFYEVKRVPDEDSVSEIEGTEVSIL